MEAIFFIVGTLILCVGVFGLIAYNGQRQMQSHVTKAKIVKVNIDRKRSGATTWEEVVPTLEYRVKGKQYRVKYYTAFSESWKKEETYDGKVIDIAYSPNDPTYIRSLSNDAGKGIFFICIGGGALAIFMGIWMIV